MFGTLHKICHPNSWSLQAEKLKLESTVPSGFSSLAFGLHPFEVHFVDFPVRAPDASVLVVPLGEPGLDVVVLAMLACVVRVFRQCEPTFGLGRLLG